KDRDLAMVFQNYALYPHMSVYDNIAFGLRMRKHSKHEIDRLVRDTAATLGIDELLKRKPGQLSGGQRQRVALGRAIVRRPQVFLMDEPLSNLDSKMRVQMRSELIRLHRELGATFIYVTHDQVEAMTMGGRLAVLNEGRLQQVGKPQEVYDRPENLFVAEFIGSPAMNLLEAEAAQVDGKAGVRAAGIEVTLPDALAKQLEASGAKSLVMGIRPEHLDLSVQEPAATFKGKVDLVESLGSEQHVTVTIEGTSLIARLAASEKIEHGTTFQLAVAHQHVQLFNAATKERIGP
ncbi:MAG: ATP-binding cassette domain-containing protein, partial [Chloroflexi bacterium]|nr:ATP-binding cassette domain-containing protein [Chloroflexota bacterium]